MEKKQDIAEKKTPPTPAEVAKGVIESIANTEDFLIMLRKIGEYKYRKLIHLSDIELTEKLDTETTNMLTVAREYYLMFDFLHRTKSVEAYMVFRSQVMRELNAILIKAGYDEPTA